MMCIMLLILEIGQQMVINRRIVFSLLFSAFFVLLAGCTGDSSNESREHDNMVHLIIDGKSMEEVENYQTDSQEIVDLFVNIYSDLYTTDKSGIDCIILKEGFESTADYSIQYRDNVILCAKLDRISGMELTEGLYVTLTKDNSRSYTEKHYLLRKDSSIAKNLEKLKDMIIGERK